MDAIRHLRVAKVMAMDGHDQIAPTWQPQMRERTIRTLAANMSFISITKPLLASVYTYCASGAQGVNLIYILVVRAPVAAHNRWTGSREEVSGFRGQSFCNLENRTMNMSMFQILTGVIMVGVAVALFYAIRQYMATQSERRMTGMLERVGLDPAIAISGNTAIIMKEIRQRCRSCTSEDVCERWLASEEIGENEFCPNRQVFESIKRTIAATG